MNDCFDLCPAKVLHALAGFAGSRDLRPRVRGVWVENAPRGLVLWATNGGAIGALRLGPMSGARAFNLMLPHAVATSVPKNDKLVQLCTEPYALRVGGESYPFEPDLALYPPDWRRVAPKSISHQVSQFDAELLAPFVRMKKVLTNGRTPGWLRLSHNGENAMRVHIPGRTDFVGVIGALRVAQAFGGDADWTFNPAFLLDEEPLDTNAEGLT